MTTNENNAAAWFDQTGPIRTPSMAIYGSPGHGRASLAGHEAATPVDDEQHRLDTLLAERFGRKEQR